VNHRPESRMREIRMYGSEGGAPGNRLFLPLSIGMSLWDSIFLWRLCP
jgi:hypothetical protein